jgi:hypothetical protein
MLVAAHPRPKEHGMGLVWMVLAVIGMVVVLQAIL